MNDEEEKETETLPSFICPIDQTKLTDPVILESGNTYNRCAIETWFSQGHNTDPLTNLPVKKRKITNYALKNASEEYELQMKKMQEKDKQLENYKILSEVQTHLLLEWVKDSLNSKMDMEVHYQHSQNVQKWYAAFKSCTSNYEPLQLMFQEYVEKLVYTDCEFKTKFLSLLRGVKLPKLVAILISDYATVEIKTLSSTESTLRQLLRKYEYFEKCCQEWFSSASWCKTAIKKSFEDVINRSDTLPRLLATYIDDLLSRNRNSMSLIKIKQEIKWISALYDMIQEKDIFERHYQLSLGNRLINSFSKSLWLEKYAIDMFREVAGFQWCNKLQGMLLDIKKPIFQPFCANFTFELKLTVCSSGFWPCSANLHFYIPKDLSDVTAQVKSAFMWQFPDRKLIWRMDMGRAEVEICFGKLTRTLVVTTYQMMILLMFNECKKVEFQQIVDCTGIPKSEIGHHLLSLAHPKVGIILKRPNTKALEAKHQFILNPNYTHPLKKIIVPLMQPIREYDEEMKQKTLQQRHQIDNSICCIMMMRGKMKHALLVAEVICRLKTRFLPKPALIKKRIEALIEQEYLERDKNDRSVYHYLS